MKERWLKYRISQAQYDAMVAAQGGRCAICPARPSVFAVDHCHKTNRVRGLLCSSCNTGIGLFRDEPTFCNSAADYLRRTVRVEREEAK